MMRLANVNVGPPGGYRYRFSDSGKVFGGRTMDDLRVKLGRYCALHSLPIPTHEQIEEQMCFEMGRDAQHICVEGSTGMAANIPPDAPDCAGLSLASIKQATFTLVHAATRGRKVEQVEAERRASICADCNQNRDVSGCKGCAFGALQSLINLARGGRQTSFDERLKTCCICGCLNKAKLWIDSEIIKKHTPQEQWDRFRSKAPNCWLLEDAP